MPAAAPKTTTRKRAAWTILGNMTTANAEPTRTMARTQNAMAGISSIQAPPFMGSGDGPRATCSHECCGVRVVQVEAGRQMVWCKPLPPIVPVFVNWAGMQFGLLPGFAATPASADRAPHSHVLTPLFSLRSSFQDEGECHRGTPPQSGIGDIARTLN